MHVGRLGMSDECLHSQQPLYHDTEYLPYNTDGKQAIYNTIN